MLIGSSALDPGSCTGTVRVDITRLIAVALFAVFFSPLNFAQAPAEDASVSPATIQIGASISGRVSASGPDVQSYLISGPEYSDLVLEYSISGSEAKASLVSKVIRNSDSSVLAEYSLGPSENVQVRALHGLEADDYSVTIEAGNSEPVTVNYTLKVLTEGVANRGIYDGIWKIGDEGYAFVYQDPEVFRVLILGNSPALGYRWESQSGILENNIAVTDTDMGYVQLRLRFAFLSPTEGSITLLRCNVLENEYPCLFPTGSIMPMSKVEQF